MSEKSMLDKWLDLIGMPKIRKISAFVKKSVLFPSSTFP
jgi:hypothetical protein